MYKLMYRSDDNNLLPVTFGGVHVLSSDDMLHMNEAVRAAAQEYIGKPVTWEKLNE